MQVRKAFPENPRSLEQGSVKTIAYCMKCKKKKEMVSPQSVRMKNGKPATKGKCPTCGTKMFRIGK